ncbi:MAG: SAM-dependent methyltransferase, partial [Chlamydiota bacterium]
MKASFRDPEGSTLLIDDKVFRFVLSKGMDDFSSTIHSCSLKKMIQEKKFISFSVLEKDMLQGLLKNPKFESHYFRYSPSLVVEHPKIDFPSYPYEWAPEMLHQAALLTIDLAEQLFQEGLGIKDASPYNILFEGPNPIFIDFSSVEKRSKESPLWLPYAQFIHTFLFPLLLHNKRKMTLKQIFLSNREGISLKEMYDFLGFFSVFTQKASSLVFFPYWCSRLIKLKSLYQPRKTSPLL